jgi:penicillin-binding protein 1A
MVEMVSAFSTFPNKGIHIPSKMILKIVDRYGRVIEDNTAVKKEEVLSSQTAYIMTSMMQSVVNAGTGQRARWMGFNRPAGGKTGTSNNFCDNWFIGYTPQITAGSWVGFDEKISLGRNQDGAKNGVPVWTEFMIAAHDSLPLMDFEEPEGIIRSDVCIESGEIATDRCIDVRNEVYIDGTEPVEKCHIHPSAGLYKRHELEDEYNVEDTTDERVHF